MGTGFGLFDLSLLGPVLRREQYTLRSKSPGRNGHPYADPYPLRERQSDTMHSDLYFYSHRYFHSHGNFHAYGHYHLHLQFHPHKKSNKYILSYSDFYTNFHLFSYADIYFVHVGRHPLHLDLYLYAPNLSDLYLYEHVYIYFYFYALANCHLYTF